MLIDSHCHLRTFMERGEVEAVLARARAAGVTEVITVGTSLRDWDAYQKLAEARPGAVHWTVGLHPGEVGEDWEDQVAALPSYFAHGARPVALGEMGLDYYRLPKFPDEAAEIQARQQAAFRAQLEIAVQLGVPVVIHSRAAHADCVRMIEEAHLPWERVVFHCFVEGPALMRDLNERGGRGSFTGIITYSQASAEGVRQSLVAQGPERLMLETDSPYLTPEPHRGGENEPAHLVHTAGRAAVLLGLSAGAVAEVTRGATEAFYGLRE